MKSYQIVIAITIIIIFIITTDKEIEPSKLNCLFQISPIYFESKTFFSIFSLQCFYQLLKYSQ
jgi:hypothetical protein